MKNLRNKDMKEDLEDFLRYIMDVHTDKYGQLEVVLEGDDLDPTVEKVVEQYLKQKNK